MDSSTPEPQWEQLEIPGLFEQLPNPSDETEEGDKTKND
jgi:hypothetical protein